MSACESRIELRQDVSEAPARGAAAPDKAAVARREVGGRGEIDEIRRAAFRDFRGDPLGERAVAARADFETRRHALGAGGKQAVDEIERNGGFVRLRETSGEIRQERAGGLTQRLRFGGEPVGEARALLREHVRDGARRTCGSGFGESFRRGDALLEPFKSRSRDCVYGRGRD